MIRRYGKTGKHANARRGFTLVELLVVMFIMAIIVALIVGVGKYVADQAAIKQTRAAQAVISRAIALYYDQYKFYPNVDSTDKLASALRNSPKAKEMLNKLSEENLSGSGGIMADGFGNEMRYKPKGGFGDRPVLISPGPDGEFGEDKPDMGGDDIYSDKDK